jgi:oligoribonuclease
VESHLIWIDLEMTGLDPERHVILEIGTLVTDETLHIVAEGPAIAVNHPEHMLSTMDAWNRDHHGVSGLLDRVKASSYDCLRAEQETIAFLSRHCQTGESPLCGNSVWQDRRFLIKHMPRLEGFLHYRNVDVSSIKELARRWYPKLPPFEKQKAHLALSDIKESLRELRYYRERIFMPDIP